MGHYCIGLDIGSVSVNAVVMDSAGALCAGEYRRMHGQPLETTLSVLEMLCDRFGDTAIDGVAVTGSGGQRVAALLDAWWVNEVIAQSQSTARLYPQVRTVIEMGGEDSKLLHLCADPLSARPRLHDFRLNTVCAAGTGIFLDQQAARLGVSVEDEFGRLAASADHPPRIAGRCSVFAKSDMIHLQQIATPLPDILMGLCLALARNVKSNLAGSEPLAPAIAFQGGVAANRGMVQALEQVFGLGPGALVVPAEYALMGAIGAVLCMREQHQTRPFRGLATLAAQTGRGVVSAPRMAPLSDTDQRPDLSIVPLTASAPVAAYLGVDIGSISTNLVVTDADCRVLARQYLMTAGQPLEAVRQGLRAIGRQLGRRVDVRGVAVTGSGRYLVGDFIGADVVKNEITAHARGATLVRPDVDTVFEIGGQDAKYISLRDGVVLDFAMNKVCAAGTGSFLEEQAEKLGVSIKEEFARLALSSAAPVRLGERCTVFMDSSLNHWQQQGIDTADLAAGLSYSVVLNYLNRVVEHRPVGDVVLFQGGTAHNRAVKAAFEQVCGKPVIVPPHHDVLGALGCARIARDEAPSGGSRFKGFDCAERDYEVVSFTCEQCPNHCDVRRVTIAGEAPRHYGSRCGRLDEEGERRSGADLPDLFAARTRLLETPAPDEPRPPANAPVVALPRAMQYFDLYPFWRAFLAVLGFRTRVSPPTNREIIARGCETVHEEICFPIKVAHGHIATLLDDNPDLLLLPCVINAERTVPDAPAAYNCLYVQSLPFLAHDLIEASGGTTRVLRPVVHFEWGRRVYTRELRQLARRLGAAGRTEEAVRAGLRSLRWFRTSLQQRGLAALDSLAADQRAAVLISRPYNGTDPGLNLDIPGKLRARGILPIPMDMLPCLTRSGTEDAGMYWNYGQRILSAGRGVARDARLHAVYLSNFSCGPDSFISGFFDRTQQGKPWLLIELDEHSADAGVITRLEAFIDSISSRPGQAVPPAATRPVVRQEERERTVYIPYMDDHGVALAAAMRYYGVPAEALPMADDESVALGRRYTSGRECYPCIITTGDMLKKVFAPDFDPERSSFFMATASGPCRFGQYSRFQRDLLDRLGYGQVPLAVLDQTVAYDRSLSRLGTGFRRLGWRLLIWIDALKKLLLATRPYELNPGEADRVYARALEDLCRRVAQTGDVGDSGRAAVAAMQAVATDRSRARPLIGLAGEIFVRSNSFSNEELVRRIEQLGGEAVLPTMQEWIQYTDWERRRDLRREGTAGQLARELLANTVQAADALSVGRPFRRAIRHFGRETPTGTVMALARPYLSEHVRGEACLTIGRAVEYARHGLHGIITLMPFGCMPGTIVSTVLRGLQRDYPDVPILNMAFDGNRRAADQTRLEAFMHQAERLVPRSSPAVDGRRKRC